MEFYSTNEYKEVTLQADGNAINLQEEMLC